MYAISYASLPLTRRPIYNGKLTSEPASSGNVVHERSIIVECNENILLEYVYRALAYWKKLSRKMVRMPDYPSDESDKIRTYTVQILGEQIGERNGNRVWFANDHDVHTLLNILVKAVGDERMGCIRESLSTNEPNDIHKTGIKYLAKWLKGEDWPL